jgi:hypothetical protein
MRSLRKTNNAEARVVCFSSLLIHPTPAEGRRTVTGSPSPAAPELLTACELLRGRRVFVSS